MSKCIPFVNKPNECSILKRYYADSEIVRISLESISGISDQLPDGMKLWIDPAVDAYDRILTTNWPVDIMNLSPREIKANWPVDTEGKRKETMKLGVWEKWNRVFGRCKKKMVLANKDLWRRQNFGELREFIDDVLGRCLKYNPFWLTVPQLPLVDKGSRNKINNMLATATKEWKKDVQFEGKLILPLIFTHQRQINSKTLRDKKLAIAKECFETLGVAALWIVDSTLVEQKRNEKFKARYDKLIELHELIQDKFPKGTVVIAGPYWGMDLVLWARGLCDHPAITLGTGYAYYISCGVPRGTTVHIGIPALRRWVIVCGELRTWIRKTLRKLDETDPAYKILQYMSINFDTLGTKAGAIRFTADFYKHWIDKVGYNPSKGRAIALYQDLSTAFVLGSQLPNLPPSCLTISSASMRKPGKVAEQLMLNCL